MNFKPGDFFFGIIDFLAFLVPGAILFLTLPEIITLPSEVSVFFKAPGQPNTTIVHWIVFISVSYIFGHFIHHLGAMTCNPVYDFLYIKAKRKSHAKFIESTEKRIQTIIPDHKDLERVAEAYIRRYQPSLIIDLDKHEANSKMFRGLVLLFLYLCFYREFDGLYRIFLVILAVLSFWRFANQRWKRQLLAYEFFAILTRHKEAETV